MSLANSVIITWLTSGTPPYATTGSTRRKNSENHLILGLLFTLIVTPPLEKLALKIHNLMFHKNKKPGCLIYRQPGHLSIRPVVFRPCLTAGLAFSVNPVCDYFVLTRIKIMRILVNYFAAFQYSYQLL
jgi:hypothetical protein